MPRMVGFELVELAEVEVMLFEGSSVEDPHTNKGEWGRGKD